MKALIVAREERAMNRMVNLVQAAGIDTAGTTSDQQAMSYLETGAVGAVVVGGGVTSNARRALSSKANGRGIAVIHAALRGVDPREYAEEELVPELRDAMR